MEEKNVHGNGLTLFFSSQVAVFILDISTPLVSGALIGKKNQVILELVLNTSFLYADATHFIVSSKLFILEVCPESFEMECLFFCFERRLK